MDRPPLAPIKQENSSISSPGPAKQATCSLISTPTPRKQQNQHGINNSPFREWAKSNLSNFDQDQDSYSPSISRGILSPFTHHAVKIVSPNIRVQIKEDISRVEQMDSEGVLPRGCLDMSYGLNDEHEYAQRETHERPSSPKKQLSTFDNPSIASSSSSSSTSSEIPQHFSVLGRLQIVELLSFELVDGKVEAHGFVDTNHCNDASFLRVRSRPITNLPATPGFGITGGDDSDSKVRVCSCKKSRCLKLYCECFAASELCQGCKCTDCANDGAHEEAREEAVERIKQRSSNAFAPKIVEEVRQDKTMHARGCRCKKSHCLKKYCECYQAGVRCGDNCKCEECHNMCATGQISSTPRERRMAEHLRPMAARIAMSPIARMEMVKPGLTAGPKTPDEDDEEDSPSPRGKRPRMLDFNMAATPIHHAACGVLDQDSPGRRLETYGHYNMFGSPSSLFLPN